MILFWCSVISGFAAHFLFYDLCQTLPMPETTSRVVGVFCVYPVARAIFQESGSFDAAFLVAFLGFGAGVSCGRIFRGHMEMKRRA